MSVKRGTVLQVTNQAPDWQSDAQQQVGACSRQSGLPTYMLITMAGKVGDCSCVWHSVVTLTPLGVIILFWLLLKFILALIEVL